MIKMDNQTKPKITQVYVPLTKERVWLEFEKNLSKKYSRFSFSIAYYRRKYFAHYLLNLNLDLPISLIKK